MSVYLSILKQWSIDPIQNSIVVPILNQFTTDPIKTLLFLPVILSILIHFAKNPIKTLLLLSIIHPIRNYIIVLLPTDRIRNYIIVSVILQLFNRLTKNLFKEYIAKQIERYSSYLFKSDSHVQKLKNQTEKLKEERDELQQSVFEVDEVTKWLSSANNEINEAEELIQRKEEAMMKKCLFGLCPSFKSRYQLGKEADKKASIIDELRNQEGLVQFSSHPPLHPILEPSVYSREALPSRMLIFNQVMDALKDPNLYIIGVYGLGGVGKTTLAKEVQRKAVEEKLFEAVIMVPVSQTPDLRMIQREIADFIGLKFDAQEVSGRASQLKERLKTSKVLIILDDIWTKLELNDVGIPLRDECKDSKLLLISRSQVVLSLEMGTEKEFSLEVLGGEETWRLFQMTVGDANNPELRDIAIKVAKKCFGLPLLVNIVAADLKNKELSAWIDALMQLSDFENEEIHGRVHKVLKSSYENLPSNEVKSLFLLCSLFEQSNIPTNHLLTYSMGLGLFKNFLGVELARKRLCQTIEKLKTEGLLIDGDMNGHVKMHDIVLAFARSIATKEQHAFFGITGTGLRKLWPEDENYTRIVLHHCDISELPEDLQYPNAELLSLVAKDLNLVIPELFFKGIRNLKVLNLTGMCLMPVPSSLQFLRNLHSLYLHQCHLKDVAIIGNLKQLKFLSFEESDIVELPRQLGELTQLKSLNLTKCSYLKVIPPNVLPRLSLLEELYMDRSYDEWDLNGNASLMELEELRQLTTLEVGVSCPKKLPNQLFSKGLERYLISIGKWKDKWWNIYDGSRTLKLRLETSIHLEYGLKELLRGSGYLFLGEVKGMENGLYDLNEEGFPNLKHLRIDDNDAIRHIIDSTMWVSCHAFPILEILYLYELNSLEEICHGQLGTGSFKKLQTLRITRCKNLRKLFSFPTVKCFSQLQELEVGYCGNLEAIVAEGSEDGNGNNEVMEFPQLRSFVLYSLPRLRGICKQREVQTEDGLFSEMISFPNLTRLDVSNCNSLQYIFKTSPEMEPNSCYKVALGLRHLTVKNMPSLKRIWSEDANGVIFPNLKSVEVSICDVLEYVFPASLASGLLQLEELKIEKCGMEKIVGMPESVPPEFKWPKLKYLKLVDCERANRVFLFLAKATPNLQTLVLGGIKSKEIQGSEFPNGSFSKLKVVELSDLDEDRGFPRILCSLEKLVLKNSSLEELFTSIVRLRCLELIKVNNLKHIWKEDSLFPSEYLETLNVDSCSHLMKIASSSVSFQNLTTLYVLCCHKLENLVAPSTAKTMVHLMELRIENCDMVTEIVANDEDDIEPDEIIFNQLKRLRLSYLPRLNSFCSRNNCTFHFPSLEQVIISECSKMTIFCGGDLITPKLGNMEGSQSNSFWKGISMDRSTSINKTGF